MANLLDEHQAAERLNASVKTLQAWRVRGDGPKFAKIGRLARYSEVELEAFIASRTVSSTAEATTRL